MCPIYYIIISLVVVVVVVVRRFLRTPPPSWVGHKPGQKLVFDLVQLFFGPKLALQRYF